MAKIIVNVTAEDIAHGIRKACRNCPVALAIKRAVGEGEILVTNTKIFIEDLCVATILPLTVFDFISKFDRGIQVKPFVFSIEDWRQ